MQLAFHALDTYLLNVTHARIRLQCINQEPHAIKPVLSDMDRIIHHLIYASNVMTCVRSAMQRRPTVPSAIVQEQMPHSITLQIIYVMQPVG